MDKYLTLGSLFDGSGGFSLGALLAGIEPLWASEIEPFPIRVTTKRLPTVKHLGDINKIDGGKIFPVDIIPFGSPCQDLSVAGRRAGLTDGERSSLFYEAIRIIKEMRRATNEQYPKHAVWENVPGVYSSNKGEDFRSVLESFLRVKDETLSVPMPENGKWSTAGEVRVCSPALEDDFSIAWRTLDAQFWGVPQRRARCYLVVDFTSGCAGKILFDESRLQGYPAPSKGAWKTAAGASAPSIGNAIAFEPGACSRLGGHVWNGYTGALRAGMGDNQLALAFEPKAYGVCSFNSNSMKSANPYSGCYEAKTARTLDTSIPDPNKNAGGMAVVALEGNGSRPSHRGDGYGGNVSFTLNSVERHAVCYQDKVGSLCACDYKFPQNQQIEGGKAIVECVTVDKPVKENHESNRYVVRRLTPTECALLQGFPRDWCDGLETPEPTEADLSIWAEVWETHRRIMGNSSKPKTRNQLAKWLKNPYSDSAAYKMWGNGICLWCAVFVLGGIAYYANKQQ